eukprot:4475303-Amphidinium_carterae.1
MMWQGSVSSWHKLVKFSRSASKRLDLPKPHPPTQCRAVSFSKPRCKKAAWSSSDEITTVTLMLLCVSSSN